MGFREDIPMDGFVQSNPVLADGFGWAKAPGTGMKILDAGSVVLPSRDAESCLTPMNVSQGARTRSTSLALESWPSVVWDVNGYYHALGVGFRATRRQLMDAYLRLDGPNDAYLTYVFKRLLDPQVRRKYDACPLGRKLFDLYARQEVEERARRIARQHRVDTEDVLRGWGLLSEPDSDSEDGPVPTSSETLDIPQEAREDGLVPDDDPEPWPYSFYLWRVRGTDRWFSDSDAMREWQEAIAAECQRRGVVTTFAVGAMGHHLRPVVRVLSEGGVTVILIAIGQLDRIDELAPDAVDRLIQSGI